MPLGYETAVVNGTRIAVPPSQAFDPLTFGQAYAPSGMWPRQGVYNVPPVLPSASMQSTMAPSAYGATTTPTDETGNPFSLTKSPFWWALGFLAIGLFALHLIHYK